MDTDYVKNGLNNYVENIQCFVLYVLYTRNKKTLMIEALLKQV